MKEINKSELDWTKNNCPACGEKGKWLYPLFSTDNELRESNRFLMECNSCQFLYDGIVWDR